MGHWAWGIGHGALDLSSLSSFPSPLPTSQQSTVNSQQSTALTIDCAT
ncbi:hypothetical protein [Calothrix anomala]|nr:hypothetical protein [Calothrix anomala]